MDSECGGVTETEILEEILGQCSIVQQFTKSKPISDKMQANVM
jgi:hypothetical protein